MTIKILMLGIYIILHSQCGTINIKSEPHRYEEVPIVDSGGKKHYYTTTKELELSNDYALYCKSHHRWETISVRYSPTPLAKLRHEEYIVRVAHKQ
jgi:hypothetical protein